MLRVIGVQRVSYCELLFLTTVGLTNQKRAVTFISLQPGRICLKRPKTRGIP